MPTDVDGHDDLVSQTAEGEPGDGAPRGSRAASSCCASSASVLRLSEADAAAPRPTPIRDDDETMIINMGPQHPSTHGVLRLMLELDGETVLRTKPIIGYLHTGMEKTGEDSPTSRAPPTSPAWTTRRRSSTSWSFSLATEKLLGIEVPAAGHVDPHADVRAEPDVARTCCSSPPTAWTSAPCR